jgi:hypothetical protein
VFETGIFIGVSEVPNPVEKNCVAVDGRQVTTQDIHKL